MNFTYEENRIFLTDENGKTIAEVNFPSISDTVVNISHTFVDDSLRGQGVAGKLLVAVAEKLRQENKKAYPTCSYAIKWFEKNEYYRDIYVDERCIDV